MPVIETAEGSIAYVARGTDGPALVFVHGAGGSHRHWGHVLGPLAARARCYALDLPGHGRSPGPPRATVAGVADVVLALLDGLELERVVLVGHSLGGAICLALAAARPERVEALALLNSGPRLPLPAWLLAGLALDLTATVERLAPLLFAPSAEARVVQAARRELLSLPAGLLAADYQACAGFDAPRLLAPGSGEGSESADASGRGVGGSGALGVPALLIAGMEDQLVPADLSAELVGLLDGRTLTPTPLSMCEGEALDDGALSSRLVLLKDVGHMALLEAPAAVVEALEALL